VTHGIGTLATSSAIRYIVNSSNYSWEFKDVGLEHPNVVRPRSRVRNTCLLGWLASIARDISTADRLHPVNLLYGTAGGVAWVLASFHVQPLTRVFGKYASKRWSEVE
jgi:hypothetical protein